MTKIKACIFDLGGTLIDRFSLTPIISLQNAFHKYNIDISKKLISEDMGLSKIKHIETIFDKPNVVKYGINNNNKNSLRLCLNYAMHEKNISKFIIGVNNVKELKQIIKFSKFKIKKIEKKNINLIQIKSQKILEPFRWNLS